MNENLDLTKILEGCEGIRLWSPLFGEVTLKQVIPSDYHHPIVVYTSPGCAEHTFTSAGTYLTSYEGAECIIFPSKDQRDWSKFEKPSKFPKTCAEAHQMLSTKEGVDLSEDMRKLISLIEARNAYWKVDGNWKPDWSKYSIRYVIFGNGNEVVCCSGIGQYTLAFRTPEIRDEFYKNFKNLIEACKDYI